MRHFDAWILRDPYSIWHYYSTGRRWQETVRDMIQGRQICAPLVDTEADTSCTRKTVDPLALSISSQPDCGLLQRLPPEIRLMIYKYVFGDEAVHLVQLKGKIRHVRCQNPTPSISSHRACCPETSARWRAAASSSSASNSRMAGHYFDSMLYPHTHSALPHKLSNSSLSLLRTCRAIYLEAADIPYSDLVFDVDDLHTFVAFSLSICPERLRVIKLLTVQWTPIWQPMTGEHNATSIYSHTHSDRLWELFWTRVRALTSLEELRISLDLGRFMGHSATAPAAAAAAAANVQLLGGKKISLAITEAWVTPMLSVRGLKNFDLCVTARCDASARTTLAEEIGRDAQQLCTHLRTAMCLPREDADANSILNPTLFPEHSSGTSCSTEDSIHKVHWRPTRLMITAA